MRVTMKEVNFYLSNELDINLVTCGDCGLLFHYETWCMEIECPKCKIKDEPCHFPDALYE